jgi:hypothetical protein
VSAETAIRSPTNTNCDKHAVSRGLRSHWSPDNHSVICASPHVRAAWSCAHLLRPMAEGVICPNSYHTSHGSRAYDRGCTCKMRKRVVELGGLLCANLPESLWRLQYTPVDTPEHNLGEYILLSNHVQFSQRTVLRSTAPRCAVLDRRAQTSAHSKQRRAFASDCIRCLRNPQ